MKHETVEKNIGLMGILIVIVISIGGLVEIVPLMASASVDRTVRGCRAVSGPAAGRTRCLRARRLLRLPLADDPAVPQRNGALRPVLGCRRVGLRSTAFSSVRNAPDRIWPASVAATRDEWHRIHLMKPQDLVPESNMPAYPWLARCNRRR